MEDLKYAILEKINHINHCYDKDISGLIMKSWYQIALGIILISVGVLSYFSYVNIFSKTSQYLNLVLIIMGASVILGRVWLLSRKRGTFHSKNLHELNRSQLQEYLKDLSGQENRLLDEGARSIASTVATLIIYLLALIPLIVNFVKTGDIGILNKKFTEEGIIIITFSLAYIFIFLIGDIIANPMTPVKYYKEREKLSNKIIFGFLTNIDNSPLNPNK